jgi:hypothetical protein
MKKIVTDLEPNKLTLKKSRFLKAQGLIAVNLCSAVVQDG